MQGSPQLREKLATACRLLYMEGLMDHAGLAGARIPETGNLLLNPREMRGTPGRHPGIFTGVFRARPDVMAVFHLHLPTATLFSVVGKPILPIGVMGSPFGGAVPVCPDGTLIQRPEQGDGVARALGKSLAVILQGHGAVITGASVEEAFVASVLLEDNAQRQYRAAMIGTPQAMAREELERARAQVWNPKVIAKVWTYYLLKGQSAGVVPAAGRATRAGKTAKKRKKS